MRVQAFEINDPLPKLREPHALAILRPWIDVGNVGTMLLARLEGMFGAREIGRLARPGNFFDFTRYRPNIYMEGGTRKLAIPNATVTCTQLESGNDFVFLHLLEPHMLGEAYTSSIVRLLELFNVKRYFLVGSMYDIVPHSRPFLVTGGSAQKKIGDLFEKAGVQSSNYQGPTTITYLVTQKLAELGIDSMSLIAHLPQYLPHEEDYSGLVRLMEILSTLYDFHVDKNDTEKAEDQRDQTNLAVSRDPKLKAFVSQLEIYYEERVKKQEENKSHLSPEVEGFLKEIENRFRQN